MQLVEILIYSNKIKTVDDLLNHFDLIIELARDDILKITKSKRLLFSLLNINNIDLVSLGWYFLGTAITGRLVNFIKLPATLPKK